jgi:hypothetical protein
MKSKLIWLLTLCTLIIASIFIGFTKISLIDNIFEKLGAVLGTLLLAALFIERGLDVFLTTLRAEDSEKMSKKVNEVQTLVSEGDISKKDELLKLQEEQLKFKSKTRIIALWSGLLAGVILSIIGFRSLESLVNPVEFETLQNFQKMIFNAVDIFITGCVLAGGSDSIHKIMDSFRLFMENKSK